jgi:hypothetical protein
LVLQLICGLLCELRPLIVLLIDNLLLRHQATHHFALVEPNMPFGINSQELHEVLMAAVRSLDLAGRQHSTPTADIGSIIQTLTNDDLPPKEHVKCMDYFAHFCDTDTDTDGPSFDVCVAVIQRFQQSHFQRGGRGGSRGCSGPPTACLHAPCSRTHPPEQCCICQAPHPVHKGWHVNGLPDSAQSICNNFKKLMQANEGPWKDQPSQTALCYQVSAVVTSPRQVSFNTSQANPHTSSLQNATEDAVEIVRTDGIEPYRSPYIRKILADWQARISPIDFISHNGTSMALPHDGPPLPDDFIASITDHTDVAIKTAYFHVNTGATCVVTDQVSKLHCPVPTKAACGTVAKGLALRLMQWAGLSLTLSSTKASLFPSNFLMQLKFGNFNDNLYLAMLSKILDLKCNMLC